MYEPMWFRLNPINKDSPLFDVIDERLNPPKRKEIFYRKFCVDNLIGTVSEFWMKRPFSKKDGFFPKWMRQNGFSPERSYSIEGWKLMEAEAWKEFNDNSKKFHELHNQLLRAGR